MVLQSKFYRDKQVIGMLWLMQRMLVCRSHMGYLKRHDVLGHIH